MSRKYQKRPNALQQKILRHLVGALPRQDRAITLHCPRKEDERISIDEQRPQPMRRKDLREVRTQA
jgi:hypothetical protein